MRSALLLALLAVCGCQFINGGDDPPRYCTAEFRMIGVTVVDAAKQPVEGAEMDVIRSATGQSIVCDGDEQRGCVVPGNGRLKGAEGRYLVMTDGVSVREGGEQFRVEVAKGAARLEERFLFAHDGCHVRKLSGPDTLRLR